MVDDNSNSRSDDVTADRPRKWRRLWPVAVAVVSLPVIGGITGVLLLWTVHLWNVPLWVLVLAGVPLTLAGSCLVWYAARRLAARRFRFGLRSLLIGMAVIGLLFGTVGRRLYQRLRKEYALQAVAASGGKPAPMNPRQGNWLRARLGYDPFDEVRVMEMRSDEATATLLLHADQFAELELLSFWNGPTDDALTHVGQFNDLPRLRRGEFGMTPLTDKGLKRLRDWTNVELLFFNGCPITDAGLAHLVDLPALEHFTLVADQGGSMSITDAGMVHIGKMSQLKRLMLQGMPVTDAGLAHLTELPNLERLIIRRTSVTEAGVQAFRDLQTDCWVKGMKDELPTASQIKHIRVWEEGTPEQRATVIRDADRIAQIKTCIEKCIGQYSNGWQMEPEIGTDGGIWIEVVGSRRSMCRYRFGDGFFQSSNDFFQTDGTAGTFYFALPEDESRELRTLLSTSSAQE